MSQDLPPGVFISQVGHQPGAVATVAAALSKAGVIRHVLLLPTPNTHSHATRLIRYFSSNHPHLETSSVEITADIGPDLLVSVLEQYLAQNPGTCGYLNISSGLSYFWAKISRVLSRRAVNIYPVYSDFYRVINVGDTSTWTIPDLGLNQLLELHEIKATYHSQDPVVSDFKLVNAFGDVEVEADFAYEERGRLFCLWDKVASLEQMRKIISYKGNMSVLNGMQIQKTITTDQFQLFIRALNNGIEGVMLNNSFSNDPVGRWRKRNNKPPGNAVPDKNYRRSELVHVSLRCAAGGGGFGEQLLVCLGNDATSTLVALFAHGPGKALILYDSNVPVLNWLADNILQCAHQLPVGTLGLLPLPGCLSGAGIDEGVLSFFNDAPILANVTPGSKGQSYAFGQLQHVKLCSIVNRKRETPRVESLEKDCDFHMECNPVPPQVLGQIQGGAGLTCRIDDAELRKKSDFLSAMAQAVALFADTRGGFWPKKSNENQLQRNGWTLTSEWSADQFHFTLVRHGHTLQGSLDATYDRKSKNIRGDWFEDVVAGAFLAAGAEHISVGMEWPWDVLKKNRTHRTEIDVVFPWKTHHVIVSVKASGLVQGSLEESKCEEIRAMALECFGRLSLPVLVYFKPQTANDDELSLRLLAKRKVLVLSLFQLADPSRLAALLNESFANLQTS